jgi:hypothetical protein
MTNDAVTNERPGRKINFGPGPAQLPLEVRRLQSLVIRSIHFYPA